MIARKAGRPLFRFVWGVGKLVAAYLAFVVVAVIAVLIWQTFSTAYQKMQARQEWALVAVGVGGDPIELDRWDSYDSCELARQRAGRESYARGSSIGLKCQGVKSWFELLRPRDPRGPKVK